MLVLLEVLRELRDTRGQDCNLDFRAAGVAFSAGEIGDDLGLGVCHLVLHGRSSTRSDASAKRLHRPGAVSYSTIAGQVSRDQQGARLAVVTAKGTRRTGPAAKRGIHHSFAKRLPSSAWLWVNAHGSPLYDSGTIFWRTIVRTRRQLTALAIAGVLVAGISTASAAAKAYTAADVKKHAVASNCWSIVNGNVYNLTAWVNRHPGGATVIKGMCGKDATAAFKNMHGLAGRQAKTLATFKIGTLAKATATPTATPSKTATSSATATPSASGGYTAAQVDTHRTTSDCWSIVNGSVYDLTAWISRHPGGPNVIKSMCGVDATAAFKNMHGLAGRAATSLASYKIGDLKAAATATAAATPTATALPTYTKTQVEAHRTVSNCWSVVNGNVYDLTDWVARHPGGQRAIKALCGINGSNAYNHEHGGASQMAKTLASFKIGTFDASAGALATGTTDDDD